MKPEEKLMIRVMIRPYSAVIIFIISFIAVGYYLTYHDTLLASCFFFLMLCSLVTYFITAKRGRELIEFKNNNNK